MKMKLNTVLAAALSVLAVGAAQAAMNNPSTGNSSVVFVAHNPTDQMTLVIDLGLSMSDLVRGGPLVGSSITWNFASSTVTGATVTADYAAAYNMFAGATSASEFTWGVMAGDASSSGAAGAVIPSQGWISTGNATTVQMAAVTTNGNTGPGLTAMGSLFAHVQNDSNVLVGNHLQVDNGASITTSGSSYGALGGNLSGRQTWNYLVDNGVSTTLQQLVAASNPAVYQVGMTALSNDATLNPSPLTFQFDIASNQLVMNPIPEPGTYALMLAGLVAVGLMARRRA